MLTVTNLILQRQGRSLNAPISLSVQAGDLVWVQGENGVGKSTLLKTLVGLLKCGAGEAIWERNKPSIFYLGHELGVKPQFTVAEHCTYHPGVGRFSGQALDEALTHVGLQGLQYKSCMQLSRGQQQRLSLACAVLSKALAWVLDEPLTALDAACQSTIQNCLVQHAQKGGVVIVASHTDLKAISTQVLNLEAAA